MTLRIALLGAGRIGRVHARAVAGTDGARLVAVHDPVLDAANAIAGAYGAKVRDVDAIMDARDVDAVLVCTPTDTHAGLIERAAWAGKAVFCEKPIALDVERTRACLSVVEETGATLMIGFNRRFDPHFRALHESVASGAVGAPEQIVVISRDPAPPPLDYLRRSGGLFKDMTIHDLDIARWLMGEEFFTVTARAAALTHDDVREAGDVDTATVVLQTADGRSATILNSRRAAYGYDQRVEVHGERGMASARNERPADIEVATAGGFNAPPLHDFFMTRYREAYGAEIAAFVACVRDGTAPVPTGADGLAALVLAEAAGRSLREGRTVRLDETTG